MRSRYDHIDLRVRSLTEARPFYETLLPALGFTRDVRIEHWLQFEAAGADSATEFFGVTESSRHVANECRIAFWADSPSKVDRLAEIIIGAALGMSKALPIMKGRATMRSFLRIPAAIGWKSAIEPKEHDESQ
jgi:hypothetical protein